MDVLIFGSCFAMIAIASKQIGTSLVKTGLPLISGFLLTGIFAGPHVLDLITLEATLNLRFVDEIALGFIAFAAGGELYLKELKTRFKSIAWVTAGLVISTFALTSLTFFFISRYIPFMETMPMTARGAVSIIAGAILVARSPSSAIAIVNELRAKGPFTQTVLGVTIIMDVMVIVLFAVNSSIADALLSGFNFDLSFILLLASEISISVLIGFIVSKIILIILQLPIQKTVKTGLILLTGYLVFVFSSWFRHVSQAYTGLEFFFEPLLICMVAGFLAANVLRFRTEFLKLLSDAGLPIYIAFFTLTGASLSLDVLARTWPVAIVLFFARMGAIFVGSFIGGTLAKNPVQHNKISWMAYIAQAGVGLGLAKEVVVEFPDWGNPFATIIISVIVLNQVVGPPLHKYATKWVKEDHPKAPETDFYEARDVVIFGNDGQASALALSLVSRGWQVGLAVTEPGNQHNQAPGINIHELSGFSPAQLQDINCHRASAIVTMLSDEDNFKICETAYERFGTQTLIARLNDRHNFIRFQELGVLIVDPSTAIVSLMDHFVRSPAAASLLMGLNEDRNVVDIRLKNPDLSGLALRDLRLPFDAIIMSIRRRGVLFIPHDYTRLESGDLVTMVGSLSSLKEMSLRFDVDQEAVLRQLVKEVTPKELTIKGMDPDPIPAGAGQAGKDRFDRIVEKSQVIDLKHPMDKADFFDMVSQMMSEPLDMNAADLNQMLTNREDEMTTVLAPGLAVPHIIVPGENKFSMLIARCKKGIRFSSGHPDVYAAFVLIGSKDERRFHLRALSAIAQIVMDPRFEKKWMRARHKTALKDLILTAQRKRDNTILIEPRSI
ncbi:MAG: PTS sugar transporter subunit IIA [Pseudomonadota bacterium]